MEIKKAIWLMNQMKKGCEEGDRYDDPLRHDKAEALQMGIMAIIREDRRAKKKTEKRISGKGRSKWQM